MANEIQKRTIFDVLVPDWIRRAFAKPVKNPKAPEHGASWDTANGVSPNFNLRESMAVYARHAYTHACVSKSAVDISSLPLKLLSGKGSAATEIEDSPVLDLFAQPNTTTDGFLFREQFIVDLLMTGNAYILIVGAMTRPTSLFRLHPQSVKIVPDKLKMVRAYQYQDGGETVEYPPERVIHIRSASWDTGASGELYGIGLVEALNEELSADLHAQRLASNVSRQGRPDVLLSPADPADIWDRRRRQEITSAYKGMTEQGGAMALSGQIKVETLNLTPRDIEFESLRRMVRENISAVTGVPSSVLGLPDANYATARQSDIVYWTNQQQRARKLEQALTRVARMFNSNYRIELDFSGIDALQSIRSEKLDRITLHMDNGMTAEEAYAYENLKDSPFVKTTETDTTDSEAILEEALVSLVSRSQKKNDGHLEKAKEDELAKIGNMREAFEELPENAKKGIERKAKEHNEAVDYDKEKTTTKFRLAVVYWRGIGAYKTNPSSVRPNVSSPEQWAMARVNSFLYALRNGRFRSGRHDTDLLPDGHPLSSSDEEKNYEAELLKGSVGDREPTNFPEDGDDLAISLRNSNYERFPYREAEDLKENWPEIWSAGGNILGNLQFRRLLPIAKRDSEAETETEEKAIRLREAWSARHFEDFRLAGVVAQIKWLTVGSRGLSHMRKVIAAEKKRLSEKNATAIEEKGLGRSKQEKSALWSRWIAKAYSPAERQIRRASEIYLEDAQKRYSKRAEILAEKYRNEEKALSFASIFGRAVELEAIKNIIGKAYRATYLLTGNDTIEELYAMTGRSRPLDFVFSNVEPAEKAIARMARQITKTQEQAVKRAVKRGIRDGLSNLDIAKAIQKDTFGAFSESRALRIAQTETTKAINSASVASYEAFAGEEDDFEVLKEWISSRDDRVRDSHRELDDSAPIPVREDFRVGSMSASSPAGFGVASEDINCRCTIAPVVREK